MFARGPNTSRFEDRSVLARRRESNDRGFIAWFYRSSILALDVEPSSGIHQKEASLREPCGDRADDLDATNIAQIGGKSADVGDQRCRDAKWIKRRGIQYLRIVQTRHEEVNSHQLIAPVESGAANSAEAYFGVH